MPNKNDDIATTREELEQQLELVQQAQTAYLDALGILESMTGLSLPESTVDYTDYTVDTLDKIAH